MDLDQADLGRDADGTELDTDYSLDDRYARRSGRVFLTGTQALVRLPMLQAEADRARGLNTAGFISGYRGSPLGMYDQALWQAKNHLTRLNIHFQPAVNEDLAATAVMGTQQVETEGSATVDGVFGLWYGKGPGVDRSGDALKHGNAFGSSPRGGVLVVCGDDHGVVSSSMPHQSDQALMAWSMPVLNPASVEEYLTFGLFGWALSRFSGAWVGFKAISETVESAASITLPDDMPEFVTPVDFTPPPGGLHYRNGDLPSLAIEQRLRFKLEAVQAFVRANRAVFPIDRTVVDAPGATLGIVTAGKAHLDLMEALRLLNLDEASLRKAGIRIRKLGLTFPIDSIAMEDFCAGLTDLLVVEEKGPVVETQIKDRFYNAPAEHRPRIWGKRRPGGADFLPGCGEMRPARLARSLAEFLDSTAPRLQAGARLVRAGLAPKGPEAASLAGINGAAKRMPYFCSGCPHNTSTKIPEGSKAFAGIGCHFMASWMDRKTGGLTQMGGEGVNWVGLAPFTRTRHVFQNLGDGTYFHSGIMAIRQAVAAKANITYKILYNDAVAMTGGQPVDGTLTVPQIIDQLRAEGVKRIDLVSDDPAKWGTGLGVSVHDRADLDAVQRDLREVEGVSVLIYDQTCATEKRRRRKKGEYPDPPKRVVINDLVCEGCGDCGVKSNCLSVAPLETEFGAKRQIDQSSCNKDYSCLNGFCPSFVTVEGGQLRRRSGADLSEIDFDKLPLPTMRKNAAGGKPTEILVAGVGGTGVVTVGALITMAAHLEGRPASVLDFMGFAQKGGAVLSHVRIGAKGGKLNQVRIEPEQADLLLACDLVVGTSPEAVATLKQGRSRVIANSQTIHTAAFLKDPKAIQKPDMMLDILYHVLGQKHVDSLNATKAALTLMGDSIGANILMLGYAWQKGEIPVSLAALTRAIELNGTAVTANKRVFGWGRMLAAAPDTVTAALDAEGENTRFKPAESLEEIIARRVDFLTGYQDAAYARRFADRIETLRRTEKTLNGKAELTEAAARSLFKLMAYKDEYEVARLFTAQDFDARIADQFEGDYKIAYHLAPPILAKPGADGEPRKRRFGPWLRPVMTGLARLKGLRGSWADPFGYTEERKMERALIRRFEDDIDEIAKTLSETNRETALALLSLPMEIRGFGPVKERALKAVLPQWDALEDAYRTPPETAFRFAAE